MQANGIKQNTPVSLHSAVVAGNGSKRRIQLHRISGYSVGHGICMHMGMDNDRWVFEMVKSSLVIFLKKKIFISWTKMHICYLCGRAQRKVARTECLCI
jgi:hypothetical protein